MYTRCIRHGYSGKVSEGKVREEEDSVEDVPDINVGHKPTKRFSPPTVSDVYSYCLERGNQVDPQRFVDYYTSNGWMVGKNKMKDWKAAVRTWEKSSPKSTAPRKNGNVFLEMLEDEL